MQKPSRLTIDKLNMDGCFRLLEAFLSYASQEYRLALKTYMKDRNDIRARKYYENTRAFFLSDYFANLTGLCGEDVVSRLDAYVLGRI